MKKVISLTMVLVMLLAFAACGLPQTNQGNPSSVQGSGASKTIGYPRIEELVWEFRNTVRYEKPVAAFDYVNNSQYTIVRVTFEFKMKEGVTSEQLQLMNPFEDALVPDEEISEMKPYVNDWIVCDPGEKAEGAVCYMLYNTEPTNKDQCELMELESAIIYYIAEDEKIHRVSYSAENDGYRLYEDKEEPYVWINNAYTKMLPKPDTRIAVADQFREDALCVKAYDMTHDAYLAYVDACEEMGFMSKYPDEDHDYSYFGTNAEGYEVYIRYIDYLKYVEVTLEPIEE